MGHIWVLYGQKSLYGAHVGLEWDKCPDSAHMGPTYTCLLGCTKRFLGINCFSDGLRRFRKNLHCARLNAHRKVFNVLHQLIPIYQSPVRSTLQFQENLDIFY